MSAAAECHDALEAELAAIERQVRDNQAAAARLRAQSFALLARVRELAVALASDAPCGLATCTACQGEVRRAG